MKWSLKVGQLAGIEFRIHATFVLLIGWVWASYGMAGKSMDAMLGGVAFIAALFACVMLHEMGHALTARQFGIRTRDITLLPIGGLARLERMPEEPKQELWIALAGPAVNVAIALVLYIWLSLTHAWEPLNQLKVATGPFVERLLLANAWLVIFNLIPAFPMDGGRVLRVLLATRMSYPRATQVAASIGQGLALVFAIIGLFRDPILLVIGLFVWIGASQEAGAVQIKAALSGTPARAAMLVSFETLQVGDTLADAVRVTLEGSQRDFPVVDRGRVIGMLNRNDMLTALEDHGQRYPVVLAIQRDFPVAGSAEMLETVFQRLQECGCQTIPVMDSGRLPGLVTTDRVGEFLLIDASLQKRGVRAGVMTRANWPRAPHASES